MIALLAAIQVLGLVALIVPTLLPGRPQWINIAIDAVRRFGPGAREQVGSLGYYALLVTALAALNGASFGVSAAVFRRREL